MCEITGELGWRPSMEVNHFLIHFRVCTEGDLGWRPDSLLQLQLPLLTNFAWCWIPQVTVMGKRNYTSRIRHVKSFMCQMFFGSGNHCPDLLSTCSTRATMAPGTGPSQ